MKTNKEIKFADIILNGIVTLVVVCISYMLLERFKIVPIIGLWDGEEIPYFIYGFGVTRIEAILVLLISFECSWIIASFLYWIGIRRFKLKW